MIKEGKQWIEAITKPKDMRNWVCVQEKIIKPSVNTLHDILTAIRRPLTSAIVPYKSSPIAPRI